MTSKLKTSFKAFPRSREVTQNALEEVQPTLTDDQGSEPRPRGGVGEGLNPSPGTGDWGLQGYKDENLHALRPGASADFNVVEEKNY